jgi:hypothetical protein
MDFKDFLAKWRTNMLDTDATWRSYEILKAAGPEHVPKALKALGLGYAGDLALPHFMALYGVNDRLEAEAMLGSWWLLNRLSKSRVERVPRRYFKDQPPQA